MQGLMILWNVVVAVIYSLIFFGFIDLDFNASYTLIIIGVYVISNVLYFRKRKNIVSFEFLFAFTFPFACFLTYFIVEEGFGFAFFAFSSNPKSLIKGIALAVVGYQCYLCGLLSLQRQKMKSDISNIEKIRMRPSMASLANWGCLIMFIIFMATGGMSVLYMYSGEVERENANLGPLQFWVLAYSVAVVASFSSVEFSRSSSAILNILRLNKLFLLNSLVIIIFLLLSGYRSMAMQVIIPLLLMYNVYVKRITSKRFITIMLCGLVFMVIIGMIRSGDEVRSDVTTLYYFRDFNAANASLGFFVDEVNRHGITGGSNYIPQTLSIVPFLQSMVGHFVDFNSFALSSSQYYTGSFDTDSGLGTNIIGDIYYTFGFLGVIVIMFLMGRFCSYLSCFKNKYIVLMYLIFTGNSIFAARVELLYVVRMLALGCIILFMISQIDRSLKKKRYENVCRYT